VVRGVYCRIVCGDSFGTQTLGRQQMELAEGCAKKKGRDRPGPGLTHEFAHGRLNAARAPTTDQEAAWGGQTLLSTHPRGGGR
jgi:hypothetical protein